MSCLIGLSQVSRHMLQNRISHRYICLHESITGGITPFRQITNLTPLRRHRAIWGIAAIVSQYRVIGGHCVDTNTYLKHVREIMLDSMRILRSTVFDEYSGNNKSEKQVCAVGKRSSPLPFFCISSLQDRHMMSSNLLPKCAFDAELVDSFPERPTPRIGFQINCQEITCVDIRKPPQTPE